MMTGRPSSPIPSRLRIGLAFNQKPSAPAPGQQGDLYAEWDDEATIAAIESALTRTGDVVRLEATEDFPQRLAEARPDIVFNIAEGLTGPYRESHVPCICDFWNIPYTGSDPLTLALCLDKSRTKEILTHHGIPTPEFAVVRNLAGLDRRSLPVPPVIVKPVYEGSSKGITQASFCRTSAEIESAAARILESYKEPALVERWLPGREFTCAVLGNGEDARVLPIVELDFEALPEIALPFYSYEAKWQWDTPEDPLHIFCCPARVPAGLARQIESVVLESYRVLGCLDWARIDVRCNDRGVPHILEVNPLPGIIPDPDMNSCFPKAARAAGLGYDQMVLSVLEAAMARHGMAIGS